MRVLLTMLLALGHALAHAGHGYALWDDLKYPAGFQHFDYVNPQAPVGGELRLVSNTRYSTFDKYNPFTLKGSPPAYLAALMFDSLLAGSLDETASGYGLLAEDVNVSPDHLWATFRLREQARFHNGDPVSAQDVKHSFDTLNGPHTSPQYKTLLADVAGVDVLDARTVRFRFKLPNRELPLTVGSLPIFSRKWGEGKTFDQVVTDIPIGSGRYRIGPVAFGRDITYVRDPNYWGRGLNVTRGTGNFERITVKIYKDNTARLEAFKAGEFDFMSFYSAGDWARRVTGKRFDSGELVKVEFAHKRPAGFQSYLLNARRPFLQDARVREALGLALDFDWMSRRLFYGSYPRVHDLFGNTGCEATGDPSAEEKAMLEPWRGQIPAAAFGPMYQPPATEGEGRSLRQNLLKAKALLHEAGWDYRDGALRNAQGQPMVLDMLDSKEVGLRTLSQWIGNLEKLGITLRFNAVDFALYQQRLDKFDYDITSLNIPITHNPGQLMAELFGSKTVDVEGSGNYMGVKSAAVDALIAAVQGAKTKAELLPACRALDRVIMHSHYAIPQWTLQSHRVAYNASRLAYQPPMPPYAGAEDWAIWTWWTKSAVQK